MIDALGAQCDKQTERAASTSTSAPSFARYLKKVLVEDGHNVQTLHHILNMIVRNRDMFFSSRSDNCCTLCRCMKLPTNLVLMQAPFYSNNDWEPVQTWPSWKCLD